MTQKNFADRLMDCVKEKRSQVIVGLDPRVENLPEEFHPRTDDGDGWNPRSAAHAVMAFNRAVIDAVVDHAVGVKPQIAFYERFGCEGMHAYASTIRYAREKGLIVLGDVKRNDIASTAEAYAIAHLGGTGDVSAPSDDFVVDAVTVNAYLGSDCIRPFVEAAAANGRGVFALVKTSNPSSGEIQDLKCGRALLYERVAELVDEWGDAYRGHGGYSLLGAVVGATYPEELETLRGLMPHAPLLVPGYGAQGGGVDDVMGAFHADGLGAVVNSSRGIIFAWQRTPYKEKYGAERWREAVWAAAADMRQQIWDATH